MTTRGRRARTSRPTTLLAISVSLAIGMLVAGVALVAAQTAQDPSEVVLVFDVSDSILDSDDGTNVEFAAALEGIADRVEAIADDLAVGNATVSFVAFGRTARPYPARCQRLELNADPAAVTRFEACLREITAEYAAGSRAPVKDRINTAGTDHVAALVEAADLLPDGSTRSAVIFFTDGQHDPPGTSRDGENVIARIRPAFEGRTPLAILPVGLGAGAGAFESDLRRLYDQYLRDMAPCDGRAAFSWPEVVFPSGIEAGAAVALALQEVTCSFTVAPTSPPVATALPTPVTSPSEAPPVIVDIPLVPGQPRVEPLDAAARVSVDPVGGPPVERYIFECTNGAGRKVQSAGPEPSAVVTGLVNGETFQCVAYAENRIGRSAPSIASAAFAPCAGLFDCNPWAPPLLSALAIAALIGAAVIAGRAYARRSRIWVTAQVDGGVNRSLGWGHEHGLGLERDDEGWYATSRPIGAAPIRIRYQGNNRFLVQSAAGIRDVHQGDPAAVRDPTGDIHSLTVRLYRKKPRETRARPPTPADAGADALGARLDGGDAGSTPEEGGPATR